MPVVLISGGRVIFPKLPGFMFLKTNQSRAKRGGGPVGVGGGGRWVVEMAVMCCRSVVVVTQFP